MSVVQEKRGSQADCRRHSKRARMGKAYVQEEVKHICHMLRTTQRISVTAGSPVTPTPADEELMKGATAVNRKRPSAVTICNYLRGTAR